MVSPVGVAFWYNYNISYIHIHVISELASLRINSLIMIKTGQNPCPLPVFCVSLAFTATKLPVSTDFMRFTAPGELLS